MLDVSNPRKTGREAIKNSLPVATWEANLAFTNALVTLIKDHRLSSHPLRQVLEAESGDIKLAQLLHLEFRYAFAQIFTDSIAHAMIDASQLEGRLRPVGKVAARFLLQLNLLDELGFVPGNGESEYAGNPGLAHYLQFAATLEQLGITEADISNFRPSAEAIAARATFEDQYGDYKMLIAVLAAAETTFGDFAGPWARNTGSSTAIDVKAGYHAIHVEQDDGSFVDDDHSEDSWYLVRQALEPGDHARVHAAMTQWLDTWAVYADRLMTLIMEHMQKSQVG